MFAQVQVFAQRKVNRVDSRQDVQNLGRDVLVRIGARFVRIKSGKVIAMDVSVQIRFQDVHFHPVLHVGRRFDSYASSWNQTVHREGLWIHGQGVGHFVRVGSERDVGPVDLGGHTGDRLPHAQLFLVGMVVFDELSGLFPG